MAPLGIQG